VLSYFFFLLCSPAHPDLHSFPTRRSSDLPAGVQSLSEVMTYRAAADAVLIAHFAFVLFVVFGGLLVLRWPKLAWIHLPAVAWARSEEHTSELQSRGHLVCRLLLEKKKTNV